MDSIWIESGIHISFHGICPPAPIPWTLECPLFYAVLGSLVLRLEKDQKQTKPAVWSFGF